MKHLPALQSYLPDPYTLAPDAVLTQLLDTMALELECVDEDMDRLRQTHWVRTAYRLADAEKLAALVGVKRLAWEDLRTFRARLLPLVKARLAGALGPNEIKKFVYDYLRETENALSDTDNQLAYQLLPGLQRVPFEKAFASVAERPLFRPLQLNENPLREKTSGVLAARGGDIPYLYRWSETNKGLDETQATFVSVSYTHLDVYKRQVVTVADQPDTIRISFSVLPVDGIDPLALTMEVMLWIRTENRH